MAIRILLADDHAVFRSGLRALLEREMDLAVVGETGTGPETLKALETTRVDVLLPCSDWRSAIQASSRPLAEGIRPRETE